MSAQPLPEAAPRPGAPRVTYTVLKSMFKQNKPICAITAYDASLARLVNDSVDVILIGDSLGMVTLGLPDTTSVTLDNVIHCCAAVSRGATRPFLVGDLPFGSYFTVDDALHSTARMVQEGHVHAVKLEGGRAQVPKIAAIAGEGIPTVAHVGLTPQTTPLSVGYALQAKTADEAARVVDDALAVAAAGAISIVLEKIPSQVAAFITSMLRVPTIGIGAGPHCSGQVLVAHDMLGLYQGKVPRFAKQYARAGELIQRAVEAYAKEVHAREFPATPPRSSSESMHPPHHFHMSAAELDAFYALMSRNYREHQAALSSLEEQVQALQEWTASVPVAHAALSSKRGVVLSSSGRHSDVAAVSADCSDNQAAPRFPTPTNSAVTDSLLLGTNAVTATDGASGMKTSVDSGVSPHVRVNIGTQQAQPSVAIIGAGAIGNLVAAKLAAQHVHVNIFHASPRQRRASVSNDDRPSWLHEIVTNNDMQKGASKLTPHPKQYALHVEDRAEKSKFDVVLITSKAQQIIDSIHVAMQISTPRTLIVPLCNGGFSLEAARTSLTAASRAQLAYGVTYNGARILLDGTVVHTGCGHTILTPLCDAQVPRMQRLAALLSASGLPARVMPVGSHKHVRWAKLAVNAVINPVAALLGLRNGDLRRIWQTPAHAPRLNALVREIATVMLHDCKSMSPLASMPGWENAGVVQSVGELQRVLTQQVLHVADATSDNISSILSSWHAGLPSEAPFLGEWVRARAASDHNLPVLVNMNQQLAERERWVIGEDRWAAAQEDVQRVVSCDTKAWGLLDGDEVASSSVVEAVADTTTEAAASTADLW